MQPLSTSRKIIFSLITLGIVVFVPIFMVLSYYSYKKLTLPAQHEGSYSQIDDVLGWRLKANSTSRYWMNNKLTGEKYFDSKVFINNDGFRDSKISNLAPKNAVVAIGDSWTFGYAVDYKESFPAHLEILLNKPVVNMGVPAYGSAQAILLFEQYINSIKPKIVIHLNHGLWNRSLCHGEKRPIYILKPCFWLNPNVNEIELISPAKGYVKEMAEKGVYPGGWLTAGNNTWSYYLISRPVARLKQLMAVIGLIPGHQSEYDKDPYLKPLVMTYTLKRISDLADNYNFKFILIDPPGDYAEAFERLTLNDNKKNVYYFSSDQWDKYVENPVKKLLPNDRRVPKDGHYGTGMNKIIAEAIQKYLVENINL